MKTPKDLKGNNVIVECFPPEFDDMGGGSPGIQVEGFLYNVNELNQLIKFLQKRRTWLNRINEIYGK